MQLKINISCNAKRLGSFLVIFLILIMIWNCHCFLFIDIFLTWIAFIYRTLYLQNLYSSRDRIAEDIKLCMHSNWWSAWKLQVNCKVYWLWGGERERERERCTNTLLLEQNQSAQNSSISTWHSITQCRHCRHVPEWSPLELFRAKLGSVKLINLSS